MSPDYVEADKIVNALKGDKSLDKFR